MKIVSVVHNKHPWKRHRKRIQNCLEGYNIPPLLSSETTVSRQKS